ncbi:MAG: UvrD-helicase domain-containing protein [Xenococcaceae cyanobacterium]
MTTRTITFADTFINELLNIPKSISKKVTKKIKILEQDPISAQGDAKKLKGYGDNIYRVRLGDYRLFYSFGSGWVKLLSVRKRDDRTYELELPEFTTPNPVPEVSSSDLQPTSSFVKKENREKTVSSQKQKLPEDNKSKSTPKSDLPFKFTSSLLQQWQIPEEYWQKILKVKHSDDILDLPIPDRLISRILDNCFPRDLAEIERSPEYKLTKPEDLERFVAGEIEAFLLKLDPEQEKLINFGNNNGAILVKGGAGTGKSTLALYRVKKLLELGYTSILFTTYTKALVNYSEQLLEQLLGKPPSQLGVKVATVDSLTYQYYVDSYRYRPKFVKEEQSYYFLQTALTTAKIPAKNIFEEKVHRQYLERLGIPYLLQEFEDVIEAWGISTLDEYLQLARRGRGVALKAKQREAIWTVYQTWCELMSKEHYLTWSQLRLKANEVADKLAEKPFQAVIIDEAQDLSPVALRFLLNLVPDTKGVYLTADASQSLYQRGFSWKQIHQDLQVTGRTLVLKRNYRNTQQIVQACTQILEGTEAGDKECIHQKPSPYIGELPKILLANDLKTQLKRVHQAFITAAKQFRLPLHGGAILCPSSQLGKDIALQLKDMGVKAKFFASKNIKLDSPYLKVMTLYSAKGLEFPFVAVMGLEEGNFPAIDETTPSDEINQISDQQLRLLYVGCSRAMRFLMVCGSAANPSTFIDSLKTPDWQYQ